MGIGVRTSNNRTEQIFEVIIWVLQKGDCANVAIRQMIQEVGSKNDVNDVTDTDDGVDVNHGWLLRIDRCFSTPHSTQSHPPASRKKAMPCILHKIHNGTETYSSAWLYSVQCRQKY